MLDVLAKLHARRLKIVLDKKFRITNDVRLEDYKSPADVYKEYKSAIADVKADGLNFPELQAFFYGNKEAINVEEIDSIFRNTFESLAVGDSDELEDKIDKAGVGSDIESIAREFKRALKEASKQIKPLAKLRKQIVNMNLSNLSDNDGPIVGQIWNKIQDAAPGISKEKLFGKIAPPGNEHYDSWPIYLCIVGCYSVLNFLGYWPDRGLAKISKISGVNSDASHVGHAAYCSALLSEDYRLCKKAVATYQFLNIRTKVIHVAVNETAGRVSVLN